MTNEKRKLLLRLMYDIDYLAAGPETEKHLRKELVGALIVQPGWWAHAEFSTMRTHIIVDVQRDRLVLFSAGDLPSAAERINSRTPISWLAGAINNNSHIKILLPATNESTIE